MIKPAKLFENELIDMFWNIAHEEKYMYYTRGYHEEYSCVNSTWNTHQFASVDKDGNIVGHIEYGISRLTNNITYLAIINFTGDFEFVRDVYKAIDDIFCKYNFNKITFNVVVGNPVEHAYDRLCARYGGTICGYKIKDEVLMDGKYYDCKIYEIMRDDYIRAKEEMICKRLEKKIKRQLQQDIML